MEAMMQLKVIESLLGDKKEEFLKKISNYDACEMPFTLIFADYADFILENIDDIANLSNIFEVMEKYASSNNALLVAASLTGFIEQLVNSCDSEPEKWEVVVKLMGPKCISHAEAWIAFTGEQP